MRQRGREKRELKLTFYSHITSATKGGVNTRFEQFEPIRKNIFELMKTNKYLIQNNR